MCAWFLLSSNKDLKYKPDKHYHPYLPWIDLKTEHYVVLCGVNKHLRNQFYYCPKLQFFSMDMDMLHLYSDFWLYQIHEQDAHLVCLLKQVGQVNFLDGYAYGIACTSIFCTSLQILLILLFVISPTRICSIAFLNVICKKPSNVFFVLSITLSFNNSIPNFFFSIDIHNIIDDEFKGFTILRSFQTDCPLFIFTNFVLPTNLIALYFCVYIYSIVMCPIANL